MIARTTKTAKLKTESRSPTLAIPELLVVAGEISKEIEGAGHEDRSECPSSMEGVVGIRIGFDTLEVRFAAAGEFLLVKST